jgi:hypothetical protein
MTNDRPRRFYIEKRVLVFYVENQSVIRWGIRLSDVRQDDPPVVVEDDESRGQWLTENTTTSEFALEMLVFAAKWSKTNKCWGNGGANEAAVRLIETAFPRSRFPDWHWPAYPTRFYGGEEIIIEPNGCVDDTWLWACARSEPEFRRLEGLLKETGVEWEAPSELDASTS